MSKFTIDFFELSFLAKACIPPAPIARSMFFDKMIDDYYHEMTDSERLRIFEYMNMNTRYLQKLKEGDEKVLLFQNRFNPENQFLLSYDTGKEKGTIEAFLHKDNYVLNTRTSINKEFVKKAEPLLKS